MSFTMDSENYYWSSLGRDMAISEFKFIRRYLSSYQFGKLQGASILEYQLPST